MIDRLSALGVYVHTPADGPFLLLRVPDGELLRKHLADHGMRFAGPILSPASGLITCASRYAASPRWIG